MFTSVCFCGRLGSLRDLSRVLVSGTDHFVSVPSVFFMFQLLKCLSVSDLRQILTLPGNSCPWGVFLVAFVGWWIWASEAAPLQPWLGRDLLRLGAPPICPHYQENWPVDAVCCGPWIATGKHDWVSIAHPSFLVSEWVPFISRHSLWGCRKSKFRFGEILYFCSTFPGHPQPCKIIHEGLGEGCSKRRAKPLLFCFSIISTPIPGFFPCSFDLLPFQTLSYSHG